MGYALKILRTAGLVATRKSGRVVFYRLVPGFPESLRNHCFRQLVAVTRATEESER